MRDLTIKALDLLLAHDVEEFSIDGFGRYWLDGNQISDAVMESLSPETLKYIAKQYQQEVQNHLSNLADTTGVA
tara:strand:- start:27 stop:248 length:222 start_codon:yes stop_codon:yes gene_type:complete